MGRAKIEITPKDLLGKHVTWSSQANGTSKKKYGKVIAYRHDQGQWIYLSDEAAEEFRTASYNRSQAGKHPSLSAKVLVRVHAIGQAGRNGKKDLSLPIFTTPYWSSLVIDKKAQ